MRVSTSKPSRWSFSSSAVRQADTTARTRSGARSPRVEQRRGRRAATSQSSFAPAAWYTQRGAAAWHEAQGAREATITWSSDGFFSFVLPYVAK